MLRFEPNQDARRREDLANVREHVSCSRNFEEFDPSSVRFVGAGTFGAVFLMTWWVGGNRACTREVVMKIQFFESKREMDDPQSAVYTETFVHQRASRLLDAGAASAFTRLLGYFRCEYPFATPFAAAIASALLGAKGAAGFVRTLSLRVGYFMALRAGDAEALRRLDLPVGQTPESRAFALQAQFVLSEYGGRSLFSVLAAHRPAFHDEGSVAAGRWLLAALFQVFFALHVGARTLGLVHIDLSLLNLLYGLAPGTGRGMRFVLANDDAAARRWFLPWTETCDPLSASQQPMITRIIDFGNAAAGDDVLEPEVMQSFERTFRWPRMRHAASYGTRRLVQSVLDVMQGRRVPYAELVQQDLRRLADLITLHGEAAVKRLSDAQVGELVRRCAAELESIWPIMHRLSAEWAPRSPVFEARVRRLLDEIATDDRGAPLMNPDEKLEVWRIVTSRWAAPMVRDGMWHLRIRDLRQLRKRMQRAHAANTDEQWRAGVSEAAVDRVAMILGMEAYRLFPPASYHNPLVREDLLRLQVFVVRGCDALEAGLGEEAKPHAKRLRRLALGEQGGVIQAARQWLEEKVAHGHWDGYGSSCLLHPRLRDLLDWLDLQYRLDESSGVWHAVKPGEAIDGSAEEGAYAARLFDGALRLAGQPFEVSSSPEIFDRVEASVQGPLYGLSAVPSQSIREALAFSEQHRLRTPLARLLHAFAPAAANAALVSGKQIRRLSRYEPFATRSGMLDAVHSQTRRRYRRLLLRRSPDHAFELDL